MADLLIKYEPTIESGRFWTKQVKRWEGTKLTKNPFTTAYYFRHNEDSGISHAYINMRPMYPNLTLFLVFPSLICLAFGLLWTPLLWVGIAGGVIAVTLQGVFSSQFLFFGLKLGLKRENYGGQIERTKGEDKAEVLLKWLNEK